MSSAADHKLLGIPFGANESEIKKAYYLHAKRTHPDKGGTKQEFQEILAAFERLTKLRASTAPATTQPKNFHRGSSENFFDENEDTSYDEESYFDYFSFLRGIHMTMTASIRGMRRPRRSATGDDKKMSKQGETPATLARNPAHKPPAHATLATNEPASPSPTPSPAALPGRTTPATPTASAHAGHAKTLTTP
jgi:curved DNA-binding protein CbpA